MKEDYLWDKSGDDAEIKGLENALAAFRYREIAPPALPQKVFTLEKPKRRGLFGFGFGLAAFASVVVILSVVWLQFSGSKVPAVETVTATNALKRAEKTAGESIVAPRETVDPVKPFEELEPSAATPKVIKVRQTVARRRTKIAAPHKKAVEPAEKLTEEEQYAYDQLMLALTITSSKLKIVQNKINNIEERSAVVSGQ